jgi:hypothetical protein
MVCHHIGIYRSVLGSAIAQDLQFAVGVVLAATVTQGVLMRACCIATMAD